MKKSLLAILLVVCILLSGCGSMLRALLLQEPYTFQEFTYTRPDIKTFTDITEECAGFLAKGRTIANIVMCINQFYDAYDQFYTNWNLADIYYYCDMTDAYWATESEYCAMLSSEVEMEYERFHRMLGESNYRGVLETDEYYGAGFFDQYTGEQTWDEEYMTLAQRESALLTEYYNLCQEASWDGLSLNNYYVRYGRTFAQLLIDLVIVRQQMAAKLGYDNYAQMAYYAVHNREYTPEDAKTYLYALADALKPVYDKVYFHEVWQYGYEPCTPEEVFAYGENMAQQMGGNVQKAFQEMKNRQLYDITYNENKYPAAFTTFLSAYSVPFIYQASTQTLSDKLTFVHEFGHFTNDYLCGGSWVGTDVAEVQSQTMEYFSLFYANDPDLVTYKLLDSLAIYVEQAAFSLFELELYSLPEEQLTVDNVKALYQQVCQQFAMDQGAWHPMEFVDINHFYTNPMYAISYVVSNDLALQLYQMEQIQPGKGLETYQAILESEDYYILEFADAYGLEDPFSLKRVELVRKFFEAAFA